MMLALFQLVATVAGVGLGAWAVWDALLDEQATRDAHANGEKALMARERLVTMGFALACQVVLLFWAVHVLGHGLDFVTPSGAMVSGLLTVKTLWQRMIRRRLEGYRR